MLSWKGKYDNKMKKLFWAYNGKYGCDPDTYAEIAYELMTYEEFSRYIKECLEKNVEIPDVIPKYKAL